MKLSEKTFKYLSSMRGKYASDLTNDIMPFWLKHGYDRVNGGIYTCLDREGNLMDSTKSVWFQGRCGFIGAYAYNTVEKNPEWLELSKSCIDFMEDHCFDTDGRMYFEVTADGMPLRKRRYVFSECFAIIAMAEYAKASGNNEYARKALDLFKRTVAFIDTPGVLEPKYLPTLQARGHSITMILINTASRVREVISDPVLDARISKSIDDIARYFVHPEYKALLETVGPNGELIDNLNGRTINPGHCIETAWFLLDEARHRNDSELKKLALTILEWSWEWGWDKDFGGIINFRDCKGFPHQDYSQDMKFWWPQTEAMIATLEAFGATGNQEWLEKHKNAHDWAYANLTDPEFGEWFGYLHRDGSVAQPAKGNIFKGPFHIPRMMIRSCEAIDRIIAE